MRNQAIALSHLMVLKDQGSIGGVPKMNPEQMKTLVRTIIPHRRAAVPWKWKIVGILREPPRAPASRIRHPDHVTLPMRTDPTNRPQVRVVMVGQLVMDGAPLRNWEYLRVRLIPATSHR
jgi:hypothetical protein